MGEFERALALFLFFPLPFIKQRGQGDGFFYSIISSAVLIAYWSVMPAM